MKTKLGSWSTGGKSADQGGYAMPATSAKQKRFMDAAAHNPTFAKKAGIPVRIAKEFSESSQGMKFSRGGEMKDSKMKRPMRNVGVGALARQLPDAPQLGRMAVGMKHGGFVKSADGVAKTGRTKGKFC